jgi:hypothetical protein
MYSQLKRYRVESLQELYDDFYNRNLSGDIAVDFYAKDIFASGDVYIQDNINAENLLLTQNAIVQNNVVVSSNLYVSGNSFITGVSNFSDDSFFEENLYVLKNINASGNITVTGNSFFTENSLFNDSIGILNNINLGGSLHASGNIISDGMITAESSIVSSGDIVATGNVKGALFDAVSIMALFADIAEKYTVKDGPLPVGTLVKSSSDKDFDVEIMNSVDKKFVGVISENPALVLNSASKNGQAIGLLGKIPIRIVGKIKKGDIVVPDKFGCGRAMTTQLDEYYKIGFALSKKDDDGEGLVMCLIK